MNISSEIEQFILSVLGSGDEITLSRNELAQCCPRVLPLQGDL